MEEASCLPWTFLIQRRKHPILQVTGLMHDDMQSCREAWGWQEGHSAYHSRGSEGGQEQADRSQQPPVSALAKPLMAARACQTAPYPGSPGGSTRHPVLQLKAAPASTPLNAASSTRNPPLPLHPTQHIPARPDRLPQQHILGCPRRVPTALLGHLVLHQRH